MISVDLARSLAAAGMAWTPESGDRFVLPDREMDDDIFVVSEMTIEVVEYPTDTLIRFNGTTEWALDSISAADAIWLPREGQLRERLGDRFRGLEREVVHSELAAYAVIVDVDGEQRFVDADAESAYARALLALLRYLAT